MPVWNVGPNKFNITGNDTLRSPWLEVTGPGERINNHWTFETLPNYAPQQVGFVDMGLHVVQPLARNEDRLTLAENGSFVLNVRGVEHLDALATKTVDLEVVGKTGFTTDGSFNSVKVNVGNHELFYTGATRDSSLFTGSGWDQVRLIDQPDAAGTQYWAVVRRADGEMDLYSLYSGYKVQIEDGGTTWGNTNGRLNYGEVDEIYAAARNRVGGDLFRPGQDLGDTGDRGSFDNIDLSNAAVDTYTDRFIAASFKSVNYASQNLHVGTAIVETFAGDAIDGTQSASRDHITSNGNHHLIVDEEATEIDGHLRLYVRDNDSGLYNRFNEVYLGTSAGNTNANTYNTTSLNAYATNQGTGQGATPVLGTAMYGFGGNDDLTGGSDVDYLFGGASTYTTIEVGGDGGLQGNIVTGGNGGDFFGVGNISNGVDGDNIMTTDFSGRFDGAAPADTSRTGGLFRANTPTTTDESSDLATRVATDRIQDWTAGVDSLRVLANGTAVIDGLGTPDGAAVAYNPDIIEDDPEKIDLSGDKVINEGKIVVRGLGNDDTIIGSDGLDWLYGNDGDNVVIAGAVGAGDGNDRVFYDTYAGRVFAAGFDAGDKVYLNKKVLEAISGTFIRGTEAANNLTGADVTLSGSNVAGGQTYTAAVAYNPEINFLHDTFYGPSGALPSNVQHTNGPGFVDGSDNYADTSTGIIGAGMFAAGTALVATGLFAAAGYPLMASGIALGAGAVAGSLGWTTPHQHATYSGIISGNFLTVLTAQNNVDTSVAVDGSANIDNKSFIDFFESADAGDGYTPAVQFTSLNANQAINQFMAVHSDEETFIYWVYSRDAIVTAGEAVKVAEINGKLFAEDFAIYDGTLDVYNYGTLAPIVIYTPSITNVGYDKNNDGDFADAGDDAVIDHGTAVVLDGGGRFVVEGQFFKSLGDQTDPFTTTAGSATVTTNYTGHGRTTGDWVQITGSVAENGIDFNGAYQITVIDANTFTFTANKFTSATGAGGVTAGAAAGGAVGFGTPGNISAGSTISVYDGVERLDADPLTGGDQVSVSANGSSFTLYDTRALGTSLTQAPDGVVTFDSGADNRYEDAQGNASFLSIINGSATVTVNYTDHGLSVGDSITITGATSDGGIDFNGTWIVSGAANANQFTFAAANNANTTKQVNTSFSFTPVSAPVTVALADIAAGVGTLTVTMADHGMLSGDSITFTSTFNAANFLYSANTAYSVTRISDTQFSIASAVNNGGGTTIPANVTFSVPNGGDQTFFLRDEKVSYYVEVTNADSGFETMSLQYDFTVGGGTATLNGGRGTDTLVISDESAALNGMVDGQIVNLEVIQTTNDAADPMTLNLSQQSEGFTFYDSDAGNNLTGGQGNDTIYGFAGNDVIDGHTGDDSIIGGSGADTLDGSDGNDVFVYATVGDLFSGGSLVDSITGGNNVDTIKIDQATAYTIAVTDSFARANEVETLAAGGDNTGNISITLHADAFSTADIRTVTLAADTNAAGTNTINASSQINGAVDLTLTGSTGADSITGGSGDDNVSGGSDNDTITGGDGADVLTGGLGNDVFVYAATAQVSTDNIVEATNGGTDRIVATAGVDFSGLTVNGSADLEGAGADEGIEQIVLEGQTNSTFTGSQLTGNTIAINESDNDGNTTLTISVAGGSTVDFSNLTFAALGAGSGAEAFDDGTDVVAITSAAGNTAENVTGTTIADTINLDGGNDIVDGGAGNDTINGGAGDDTIVGGSGADAIDGGNGNDTLRFASGDELAADTTVTGGEGSDTIEITVADLTIEDADFTNVLSVETLVLTGASSAILGAEAMQAGITTVRTGSGATSVTRTDTTATTVDANLLANNTTLTIADTGVTTNFVVNNLVGDLDASTLGGTLTVDLADNTADQGVTIAFGTGNLVVSGSDVSDTLTISTAGNIGANTASFQVIDLSLSSSRDVVNAGVGAQRIIVGGTTADLITTGSDWIDPTNGLNVNYDRVEFLDDNSLIANMSFDGSGDVVANTITTITDYNDDVLDFEGAEQTAVSSDGSHVTTGAGGKVTVWKAAVATLEDKIGLIQSDNLLDAANTLATFEHAGDLYVYYAGANTGNQDDQLIKLEDAGVLDTVTLGNSFTISRTPPTNSPVAGDLLLTPTGGGGSGTAFWDNNANRLYQPQDLAAGNFGTSIGTGDDFFKHVDIRDAFANGIDMYGTAYSDLYMGSNGYVTFGSGYSSYTPSGIPGFTRSPMIAASFDDLYISSGLRRVDGTAGDGTGPYEYTGNSTGSGGAYYHIEVLTDGNNVVTSRKVIFTWDNVDFYGWARDYLDPVGAGTSMQIIIHDLAPADTTSQDFGIEIRYEDIGSHDQTNPTAGWTAGDSFNYGLVNDGQTLRDVANSSTNVDTNGVWVWSVEGGEIQVSGSIDDVDNGGAYAGAVDVYDIEVQSQWLDGGTAGFSLLANDHNVFALNAATGQVTVPVGASLNLWKEAFKDAEASFTVQVTATNGAQVKTADQDFVVDIADTKEDPVVRGTVDGNDADSIVDHDAASTTLTVYSTSSVLNNAQNSDITTISAVSMSVASAGVTLDLSNQTEGFTITGSGFNDNITASGGVDRVAGGVGNDTIIGGAGADVLAGGDDNDTFKIAALADIHGLAESIYGGMLGADSGTNDRIIFDVSGSADLSLATITGIEGLVLNAGSNAITMTAAQHNGFTGGIIGGGGADQITLTTAGIVTASSAVEAYVLSGAGASTITVGALNQNVTEDGTTEQANT
ncbi:nidogen-like domain-containing protein, partial [Phaeovulum sp. NW3]|uniref:nidogen-like domain-containing protein n=1 Tax=Phaeovulum sp. NW3 TaxID=2934933 RepID=UPI0032E4716E|nr:hypothetical protein [Phaeovulum sp. NW3]